MKKIIVALLLAAVLCGCGATSTTYRVTKSHTPYLSTPISFVAIARTAAALTTSYVETNSVPISGFKSIIIEISVTKGSLTSFEMQLFVSDDNSTFYQETTEAVSGGTITLSDGVYSKSLSSATENFFVKLTINSEYVMFKVKGTGTATGSSCAMKVVGRY